MITLTIPFAFPSNNRMLRMHWAMRRKLKGDWQWLVKAEALRLPAPIRVLPRAKLIIERFGPKMLDYDNLVGGAKGIVDSLVSEGFFVDDSPAHLTSEYRQHIGKPSRTVISIEAA